jgi:hypothetical protein
MKPEDDIEKFVKARKPNVTTSREMDKRTLDDSLAAMEQTMRAESAPSTARIITFGRVIKLAAAAALITAGISFFYFNQGPVRQKDTDSVTMAVDCPAEIMTMKSLKIAFRRGGLKAIENECDKALEILGPEPASISMANLFNGSSG